VHKAIRRITPAPKSRVPKGRIVEEPPALQNNTVDENTTPDLSKVHSASSESRRLSSGIIQPLGPRFTLRNNPDAPEQYIVKRGTDEIREHLKHLGPSNLASRPRQTRYQNVKIKAPGTSPSRSGMTDSESTRLSSENHRWPSEAATTGSAISSKLLVSPSFSAKDGVQAVMQGYGTIDGGVPSTIRLLDDVEEQGKDDSESTTPAISESQSENQANLSLPYGTPSRSHANSVQSFQTRSSDVRRSEIFKPGPTRSGSITEQVIDVNGIRKVVLQTTSSSSSENERDTSGPPNKTRHDSNENALVSEPDDGETINTSKKRRRRRKKKKQADDPENAPLLPR
jgi:metal transporter CNNM